MMTALKKKVALELLKSPCKNIESLEEAEVFVGMLEVVLSEYGSEFVGLAAPEVNVMKRAAIIRTVEFSINLINPVILETENRILSLGEKCTSFPDEFKNCLRWNKIVIRNGFDDKPLTFTEDQAILIQHEIDHLEGKVFHDRAVKMAVVREGGLIKFSDFCPCGSGKRFMSCCSRKS